MDRSRTRGTGAKLRILHVTASYPIPPRGGIEIALYNTSRSLSRLGHDVVVVAPSKGIHETVDEALFTTVECLFSRPRVSIPRLQGLRDLKKHIEWADIVHVHSSHEMFSQISALLAKAMKKRLIVSVLAHLSLLKHTRPIQRLVGIPLETWAQTVIRIADAVQVKNVLDYALVTRVNPNTILICDGVSKSMLSTPRREATSVANLNSCEGSPVMLYLGRIHPLKGPQEVVRMLPLVIQEFPHARAVFAGFDDNGFAAELRNLAEELGVQHNTLFLGAIDDKTKLDVIDAADVVVIPSLSDHVEAFSITASEAWARGKPVVAYSIGALKYRVREGLNGYLASPGDFRALANKTIKALESIDRSVTSPVDVVSWSRVAEMLDAVYHGVGEGSHGVS